MRKHHARETVIWKRKARQPHIHSHSYQTGPCFWWEWTGHGQFLMNYTAGALGSMEWSQNWIWTGDGGNQRHCNRSYLLTSICQFLLEKFCLVPKKKKKKVTILCSGKNLQCLPCTGPLALKACSLSHSAISMPWWPGSVLQIGVSLGPRREGSPCQKTMQAGRLAA